MCNPWDEKCIRVLNLFRDLLKSICWRVFWSSIMFPAYDLKSVSSQHIYDNANLRRMSSSCWGRLSAYYVFSYLWLFALHVVIVFLTSENQRRAQTEIILGHVSWQIQPFAYINVRTVCSAIPSQKKSNNKKKNGKFPVDKHWEVPGPRFPKTN